MASFISTRRLVLGTDVLFLPDVLDASSCQSCLGPARKIGMSISLFIKRYPLLVRLLYIPIVMRRVLRRFAYRRKGRILDEFARIIEGDVLVRVPGFEGSFWMSPRSDLFRRILTFGDYETEIRKLFLAHLDKCRDVIDVGANIGFFSILAAKHLGDKARVLAIEPTTQAARRLGLNAQCNAVAEKLVVFRGAASDLAGNISINVIEGKEEYSSIGELVHPAISRDLSVRETIPAARLDDLIKKYDLKPGLIKIDVEGSELSVIKGGLDTLTRCRPVIISELSNSLLNRSGVKGRDVVALIESCGYRVHDLEDSSAKPGNKDFGDIICLPMDRNFPMAAERS
jgi:FkbM family methyltransferase